MTLFDRKLPNGQSKTILITQGEFAVSDNAEVVINTLLGSCVAVCLWDPDRRVGGMNHLLLVGDRMGGSAGYDMAGVAEMECLINEIIKLGGRRDHLQSKVFGGAQMLGGNTGIGRANVNFALDYLKQENIPCQNSSVGGNMARALRYWATTGRVSMKLVKNAGEEPEVKPAPKSIGNDLELF